AGDDQAGVRGRHRRRGGAGIAARLRRARAGSRAHPGRARRGGRLRGAHARVQPQLPGGAEEPGGRARPRMAGQAGGFRQLRRFVGRAACRRTPEGCVRRAARGHRARHRQFPQPVAGRGRARGGRGRRGRGRHPAGPAGLAGRGAAHGTGGPALRWCAMTGTEVATSAARPGRAARAPMTVALVLVVGSVMATLDHTIVHVAINRLSAEFTAPLPTVQWVATGYALAVAGVVPVAAWAMGRFGAKRLYLVAVAVFAFGSLLAAAAWNIESLIAFRVVQGLGGGLLMPVGMTVLLRAADPERLGRAMSTMGLAILVGP